MRSLIQYLKSYHVALEKVKEYLSNGAKVHEMDSFGRTPLLIACNANQKKIIPLLLKYGANVNHIDNMGQTPL